MSSLRMVGQYIEWACRSCGCAMFSRPTAPAPGEDLCAGCMAMGAQQRAWQELVRRNGELELEVARLSRETAEQCDQIQTQRDTIVELQAMVERAHTGGARTEPPPANDNDSGAA